jgi:hypothetical protein
MLDREQFGMALSSVTDGITQMVAQGHPKEALALMGTLPSMIWDLTRPDTRMESVDLTPRLSEVDGHNATVLWVDVVYDEHGKPMLGYGRGKSKKGMKLETTDSVLMPMIEETLTEMGVDLNNLKGQGLASMSDILRGNTEKLIDDEVAAFGDELDSILDNWTGGGG